MEEAVRTYLVIGHAAKDVTPAGRFLTGGTVNYAAYTAKRLGWHPIIVTAAGPDFRKPECLQDVEWHILPSPHTTTFHNIYRSNQRRQRIERVASAIGCNVPRSCLSATLIHLAPLAQEVDPQLIVAFDETPLVVTPQGWMREWDDEGNVFCREWSAETLPRRPRTIVISIEDIGGDWNQAKALARHATVLVVTEADQGCTIFNENHRCRVPARPADVVDPTGAGDVFAAAFFIRYWETADTIQSARFANVAASLSIERTGIDGIPARTDVEQFLWSAPQDLIHVL